jgi:branched-chain amino acid transport system substrate-binding protein
MSKKRHQMIKLGVTLAVSVIASASGLTFAQAQQKPPIKVGLLWVYSGLGATEGIPDDGFKIFQAEHGDTVNGRKVEFLPRDTTGVAPDHVKRVVQELIVRDKIDFLAGGDYTPNVLALGPISTQAKMPFLVLSGGVHGFLDRNPYFVRMGYAIQALAQPLGDWAAKTGLKKVYTLVPDFAPGIDAELAFTKAFKDGGGTIVGSVRVPLAGVDISAYILKIKDAKPDAVFAFQTLGEPALNFLKAFNDSGLREAGVKVLTVGAIGDDSTLAVAGKAAEGVITGSNYSADLENAQNKKLVAGYQKIHGPNKQPNFAVMTGYDIMAAIYKAVERQPDALNSDRTIQIIREVQLDSARGPVKFDAKSREIVQNIYIQRVEMRGSRAANVTIDTYRDVIDPGNPK